MKSASQKTKKPQTGQAEKKKLIRGNIRGASQRKEAESPLLRIAEKKLRESEMQLKSLFENSPIPLWEEDFSEVKNYLKKLKLSGKPADAVRKHIQRHPEIVGQCVEKVRIIGVNRACLTLHNARDKASLLAGLGALVTEESREALQRQIVAIATGQTEIELDSMVQTLDGRRRHVHLHWSVVPGHEETLERVIVSTEDVSDRKEMEEALNASEKRFRSLIENNHDAIALLDARGRLLYESPSGLQITGYTLEERVGGSGLDLLHSDDLEKVRRLLGQIVQKPQAVVNTQVRSHRKDGNWRWLDVTAVNMLEDKAVGAIVINYRDITENKEAEAALAKAERVQNLLLESVGEGIHGLDIEGRIMFENAASLKTFGWEAEEMKGRNAHALVHHHRADGSAYPLEECPIYRTQSDGETRRVDNEVFFRKDGTSFPVEYTCSAMKDDGSITGVVVSFRDVAERKQNEEALQREKLFSDAIINSLPGIFYLFDETGQFLRWNKNFERVSGYSGDDISAMRPTDFFTDPEKEYIRQQVEQVFVEGVSDAEADFMARDGTRRPFYFTGVRVELNGKPCLLGVGVDITERRRAEILLRNLSLAVNASGDVVFMTDRQGIITSINSQFTEQYGYAPEEIVGKTTPRILKSGAQGTEVYEKFWQTIVNGEMFRGRVINKARDGSLIHVEETVSPFMDEEGNVAGFLAIQRNVTERKRAEDQLRLAEERYRALVENVPAIIYMDEADETSANVYTSPQIEKMLGYTPAMFAEKPTLWYQHVDKRDYPAVMAIIKKTLKEGFATQEYRFIARDGRTVWVRDSANLIRDEAGNPRFIQGFIEDITAQKQSEETIEQNLRELTALHNIGQSLGADISLERVVRSAVDGIVEATQADLVMFFLKTEKGLEIQGMGPADSKYQHNTTSVLRVGECLCGLSAREKTPIYSSNINADMRCTLKECKQAGLHSFASLPLISEGEVIGVLGIASAEERDFEKQALFLEAITVSASISVRNALLYEKVRLHASELEKEIAARQQIEQALVKSERDYRYLFNNAGDAILIFEPQNEIILQANATACRLYGLEYSELVGKSLKDLTKNVARGEAYISAFIKGRESGIFESVHINKNGDEIQVLISSSLIEYQGGRAVLALVRNVTERKQAEEALQRSEARLSEAQRIAHLGNWEWDITANTVWWSEESYRIFGLRPEEFEATVEGFLGTVHPGDREIVSRALTKSLKENASYNLDHRILLPDGTEKFVYEQAVLVFDDSGTPARMAGITLDITERKRAEANVQRQISHLRSLRDIDMAITSGFDMRINLKTLLRLSTAELGVDAAAILLLNPNLNLIEYAAGHGFKTRGIERSSLTVGEGHAGNAALQRKLVQIADLSENPAEFSRASLLAGEDFVCYFGVPLIAKGMVKGVMEVFHRSPLDPDQDWHDLLLTLAGQAAIAVENAQLFNNLQLSNMNLLQAYDSTIEGWSRALDLRDKETEGHTQRVADMALRLGQKFGLRDEELKYIRWGGLLHDIGKMGVPDAILFKPKALTPEELEIMRMHPVFAYQMLSPIQYLKPALDIPYCHHEKWDGSGYPRGLKGEQIPLAARIFIVADVWDAVTSDRPYRPAWTHLQALAYIREQAGLYFDPQAVDLFLTIIETDGSITLHG